jgi:hypothetical protein
MWLLVRWDVSMRNNLTVDRGTVLEDNWDMTKGNQMEIKDYIRPTQIVRSVMRANGKPSYMIYTNKYAKCRTVKCYQRGNSITLTELVGDIRTALCKAGVADFSIKSIKASNWASRGGMIDLNSIIVRIPFKEQA